jgi:hypothetical protein
VHAQPRLSGKRDTIVLTIAASTDVAIEAAAAALDDLVVDALDVSAYRVPTEMPEADGTMQWDATTVVVVEPRIRNGARGLGYSYGHAAMVDLIKGTLERHVLGKDVRETTAAWESMVHSVRNLGRPGLCSMAIAAVDIALHDTKARCLGQPLHRLLGGMRDEVPIYGSGGFTSYTERQLIDQLSGWVERGIPRVKMKIGIDSSSTASSNRSAVCCDHPSGWGSVWTCDVRTLSATEWPDGAHSSVLHCWRDTMMSQGRRPIRKRKSWESPKRWMTPYSLTSSPTSPLCCREMSTPTRCRRS